MKNSLCKDMVSLTNQLATMKGGPPNPVAERIYIIVTYWQNAKNFKNYPMYNKDTFFLLFLLCFGYSTYNNSLLLNFVCWRL